MSVSKSATHFLLLICIQFILVAVKEATSAPSSISFAQSGSAGASASAGAGDYDYEGSPPMSGVPQTRSGSSSGTNSGSASGTTLLSRSGGSGSQQRSQTVVVGPNGETTVLQQNGDQPPKVYKING